MTTDKPVFPEIIFRRSKRVVLRPLMASDYILLQVWINDPEVTQFLNAYLPAMEEDQKEWIEKVRKEKSRNIIFMIVVDGKPIGTMGIHGIDHINRIATTGALIGEKEYWGKGYGSEAKMLVLQYAFHVLNLRKIVSNVIAFNGRSKNYSLKCGYVEEGRRKEQYYVKGSYHDEILMAVFRPDWEPLWETFVLEQGDDLKV